MVTAALFTITKTWKQHKCPSLDEWIKKLQYTLYNGILFSHKKREISSFTTTWMGIMLSKISQTEKDKYLTISLICGV